MAKKKNSFVTKVTIRRFLRVFGAGVIALAADAVTDVMLPGAKDAIVNAVPAEVRPLALPVITSLILAADKFVREVKKKNE